jgi:hypothetical protein
MQRNSLIALISFVIICFVMLTLIFQNICSPTKNIVSNSANALIETVIPQPANISKQPDPLSYEGVKRVVVKWVSQYCAKQ